RYWPGQDPIGQRIEVGRAEGRAISAELDEPARTVVGVVRDMRDIDLRTSPRRAVFVPRAQAPAAVLGPPAFVIRTEHAERVIPAVRRALHEVDPSLPAPEFGLLSDLVGASLAPDRAVAAVMGAFAAVALLLTAIGIYGVLAYTVRQRTHDIGIRLALGADRGRIVRLIVRQGVAMAGAGMIVGLLASAALTRVLAHMLYGVRPGDPRVYAAVVVTLAAAALLASWLPARRAARLDPSEALRQG
ncbi:MAG: FtsX-like permease family protein, partial [Gemmatimonadetes bacterium]|nr:FtsX-like permease family protein [Gemmatimonadota bacterium]